MFKDYTLQTTQTQALVALATGAVVGSVISALQSIISLPSYVDFANVFQCLTSKFLRNFILGFFLWMFFLLCFGTPAWLLAHYKGYRGWGSAFLVGFLVPFTIVFALKFALINKMRIDYLAVASDSASFAILGSLVALTIWRIAYRRPAPC